MVQHDIIDNRNETLVGHIQTILPKADVCRFAVGYLFLSGLQAIGNQLSGVKELRLLIGNTSNRETIELLAEGRRRIELVNDRLESLQYPKRVERKRPCGRDRGEYAYLDGGHGPNG